MRELLSLTRFRLFLPQNRTMMLRGLVISMPILFLAAYLAGGEKALLASTVVLPFAGLLIPKRSTESRRANRKAAFGILYDEEFEAAVANLADEMTRKQETSALFMIAVEDTSEMVDRFGPSVQDRIFDAVGTRLRSVLRDDDILSRYWDDTFALCLSPGRRVDLEAGIQMAGRIMQIADEPVTVDGTRLYLTLSCGFCLWSRAPSPEAKAWLDGSQLALSEARKQGGGAIRSFSKELQAARIARTNLRAEVTTAIQKAQIVPYFQPQLSTHTGKVSGFEALARWHHPEKGVLPPLAFLDALQDAGLMNQLCETMINQSLNALSVWERAGHHVPQIGVNFSAEELMLPGLPDRIAWELDRFSLPPERLAIEILETVMADSPDDMAVRNINTLRDLGCTLDLDDFGTGHASLSAIRRFRVNRTKIDRSFVMKSDRDPDQQQMIAAILTMAEQLGVQTLAEGVETTGEHALLAQLGCDHVQGFGIARPMPFEQTKSWLRQHAAKLDLAPKFQKRSTS